jgi:hypothetical protein
MSRLEEKVEEMLTQGYTTNWCNDVVALSLEFSLLVTDQLIIHVGLVVCLLDFGAIQPSGTIHTASAESVKDHSRPYLCRSFKACPFVISPTVTSAIPASSPGQRVF